MSKDNEERDENLLQEEIFARVIGAYRMTGLYTGSTPYTEEGLQELYNWIASKVEKHTGRRPEAKLMVLPPPDQPVNAEPSYKVHVACFKDLSNTFKPLLLLTSSDFRR